METLRIDGAVPGIYRLHGESPTIYYLDLRRPRSPHFLRIPGPGSNAMDFDHQWQSLSRITSYAPGDTTQGVVRVGARHKLERSPGPWDTPWVRATVLRSIELLSGEDEAQLLAKFSQGAAATDDDDLAPYTPDHASMTDTHREALLDTPTLSFGELARIRGTSAGEVESWAQGHAARLLTVSDAGRVLIPSFQLTESGELRKRIGQVNALLSRDPSMDGWQQWVWWHSSFLSGKSPVDIIESDYARVLRAVTRMTRHRAAQEDTRILAEQGAGDELDSLVEWTATQPDMLSPEERRELIGRITDEMATEWADVFRRLRDE